VFTVRSRRDGGFTAAVLGIELGLWAAGAAVLLAAVVGLVVALVTTCRQPRRAHRCEGCG
jgi:ABC-type amino acid transport system permease subunit